MKQKNTFWLSLVCGMTLACFPVLAQAPQEGAPAPPPPNGEHSASPLPPMPPLSHLDPDQRDSQRTISGPYRLTYTLTEMDGTKRVGSQRYTIDLDADARPSHLNLQSNIPVAVLASPGGSAKFRQNMKEETRIDSNLRQFANGMELSTQIGQDSFAKGTNDGSAVDGTPPITRQSFFESTVLLSLDKPVTIGQLDIPGSTHSLQIQVELTKVP
jgi:hypothetical protein